MRMLIAVVAALFTVIPTRAEEWPAWRGPRGDGTTLGEKLPLKWSLSDNIAWKTPIVGKGHSSPIIWGNRVFLTTCEEKQGARLLVCIDRGDGKILWQQEVVRAPLEGKHNLNSYASSTPATDGERVFVTFLDQETVVVACYDFAGKQLWRVHPGKFFSKHGFCSPPIPYKDRIIVNCDQDAEAWIISLEAKTGKEQWRADRPNRTRSYVPPLVTHAAGKMQLVLSGSKCVASYDPDTGKQHWIIDGPTEQFVASLIYHRGLFFLTAGYPTYHLMAIKPDGAGNVTNTHVAWTDTKGAGYVPSPVADGDYFFVVTDKGVASCLEATTGKRPWMERLGKKHSASPIAAGGYLYFPDEDGTTFVVRAGPKFEIVSKNPIGDEIYASPAAKDGQLFLRTLHHLVCIGKRN